MGRNHSTISQQRRAPHFRRRRRLAVFVGAAAILASACGSDGSESTAMSGEEAPAMSAPVEEATDMAESSGAVDAPATGGAAGTGIPVNDLDRDIIRNVNLTMLTGDVSTTVDDVRRIAASNGGAVFGSDVTIGDTEDDGSVPGGGNIVIRVPPRGLDQLIADLDGAGFVSRLSQDSQDVTEQLVDLEIRIRQAEIGIDRIEQLLIEATELGDVFAIETELTNRQVALEQLRAAERNTADLVALATLTVNIEYRAPDVLDELEDGGDRGIGDALADGWSAFVGTLFAIGYLLAISAPFLLTMLAIVFLGWIVGRRWSRRNAEIREQRRQAADRRGSVAPGAMQPTPAQSTPPPPQPSQRIADTSPSASPTEPAGTSGTDTLTQDGGEPSPEE